MSRIDQLKQFNMLNCNIIITNHEANNYQQATFHCLVYNYSTLSDKSLKSDCRKKLRQLLIKIYDDIRFYGS